MGLRSRQLAMSVTPPRNTTSAIPAYNAAAVIAKAIASARSQTVPALEIIVVDNGSRENTPEIAEWEGTQETHPPNGALLWRAIPNRLRLWVTLLPSSKRSRS